MLAGVAVHGAGRSPRSCCIVSRHIGSRRRDLHIVQPGAHFRRQARKRGHRREIWGLVVADPYAGIGDDPVGGGEHVAGGQRAVQGEIDWRKTGGIVAIAGAVGAQH